MIYKQATVDATNLQTVITDADSADSATGFGFYSFCAAAAMVTVMADVVSATSVADAAVARATDAGAGFGFCFFCVAAATATVAADVGITMAVAAANF